MLTYLTRCKNSISIWSPSFFLPLNWRYVEVQALVVLVDVAVEIFSVG